MPLRTITKKTNSGKIRNKKYTGILEQYRKSDGVVTGYYVSYRDATSKACKHRVDAKDRDEALLILNKIKAKIKKEKKRASRTSSHQHTYIINEIAQDFFEQKKDNANNHNEIRRYENHLMKHVGTLKTSQLLPRDIEDIQSELTKKGLSNKSINLATDLLRSILRYGFSNRMVERNHYTMDGYSKLKVDNEVERFLLPDEIRNLFSTIKKPRLQLFIAMSYFTAQRPESLLRLQVKDIANDHIFIAPIKKQKSHDIKIHEELAPLLYKWIEDLNDDDFIFYGKNGKHKPISYERLQMETFELFAPFNKGLNYKKDRKKWVSLYTLRHSAAIQILKNTGSLKLAGSVLNHSDQRVTERYARILDEEKNKAISAL